LSENSENPITCEPVVLFNGGPVRILMLLNGPRGRKEPVFQIILDKPDGIPGAPNGAIRMTDLAMLHQLTGEALRNAVAAMSSVLTPQPAPKPDDPTP
jgi:hypothetical protein